VHGQADPLKTLVNLALTHPNKEVHKIGEEILPEITKRAYNMVDRLGKGNTKNDEGTFPEKIVCERLDALGIPKITFLPDDYAKSNEIWYFPACTVCDGWWEKWYLGEVQIEELITREWGSFDILLCLNSDIIKKDAAFNHIKLGSSPTEIVAIEIKKGNRELSPNQITTLNHYIEKKWHYFHVSNVHTKFHIYCLSCAERIKLYSDHEDAECDDQDYYKYSDHEDCESHGCHFRHHGYHKE